MRSAPQRLALQKLRRLIERVSAVSTKNPGAGAFRRWRKAVDAALVQAFGETSSYVREFRSINFDRKSEIEIAARRASRRIIERSDTTGVIRTYAVQIDKTTVRQSSFRKAMMEAREVLLGAILALRQSK